MPSDVDDVGELDGEVLPQPPLGEPVEGDRADHHRHQRDGARPRLEPRQAGQRRAQADDAVARLDRRDAREQVEVDGERLAVARPRLDALDDLRDEREHRVAERRGHERRRAARPSPTRARST